MNINKKEIGILLLETPLQGVLIFFAPRALRLLGAFGNAFINSQRTKQHICKPRQPQHNQSLQKSCFLALAPMDIFIFGTFIKQI